MSTGSARRRRCSSCPDSLKSVFSEPQSMDTGAPASPHCKRGLLPWNSPRRWEREYPQRRAIWPWHWHDRTFRRRRPKGTLASRARRAEKIAAFALTEPNHGSDSVALETRARRVGDHYVLDGAKRWIGLAHLADLVIVWARDSADEAVKAFVVERRTDGSFRRLSRTADSGQDRQTSGRAGRHPPLQRSCAGSEPTSWCDVVPCRRGSPQPHSQYCGMGGGRSRARGVRVGC